MTTVFAAHSPPDLEHWLQRRRELGQDRFDEVWEGIYHVAPGPSFEHGAVGSDLAGILGSRAKRAGFVATTAFNVGEPDDFRVPDGGIHRQPAAGTFLDTAAMVIEVVSPGDESFAKFDFYAAHGVEEVLIADPATRSVRIWQLRPSEPPHYAETGVSDVLTVGSAELAAEISWP